MKWVLIGVVGLVLLSGMGMGPGIQQTPPRAQTACDVPTHLTAVDVAGLALAAGFTGHDVVVAVAVSRAESAWDPTATNENTNGTTDYGLWQINSVHAPILASGNWSDPLDNARMAYAVWKGGGWNAWTGTYVQGLHLPYMAEAQQAFDFVTSSTTEFHGCEEPLTLPVADASVADVVNNPRIGMNSIQLHDLESEQEDPRIVDILAWIAERHTITITALKSDHGLTTKDGYVSNHSFGRAVDIGIVDGKVCAPYGPNDPCGQLVYELAALSGPMKPTELIAIFDPNPADPTNFARSDHDDHVHVAFDR